MDDYTEIYPSNIAPCPDCGDEAGLCEHRWGSNILYVHPCTVCGENTGFTFDAPGSCAPCTPHICIRELPTDTWCDICGKDL